VRHPSWRPSSGEFDFAHSCRASGLTVRDTAGLVEELVRRRMLHGVDERFDFTHDRIREVVYGGLLPPRRTLLHGDVAVALEALTAGTLDPPAAALGMHYRHAEAWDKAVFYLRQAAGKAAARSALPDAGSGSSRRSARSRRCRRAHPRWSRPSTSASSCVSAGLPEPRRTLERAAGGDHRPKLNDDRQRGRVCRSCRTPIRGWRAGRALVTGTRALEIASDLGDSSLRIVTTIFLELTHYYRGEYERAVELAVDSLAVLPAHWVYEYFGMGALPSIWHRCYLVMNLAELGRFTEAGPHVAEAIRLAEPTKQAFNIGVAYRAAGTLELLKGDCEGALIDRARIVVFRTGTSLHIPWAVASPPGYWRNSVRRTMRWTAARSSSSPTGRRRWESSAFAVGPTTRWAGPVCGSAGSTSATPGRPPGRV
jgi:tetratricopeptide (TPR) repeat protein